MRKILKTTLIILFSAINFVYAQDLVQGKVLDSLSNEPLMGAHIVYPQGSTISDDEGKFIIRETGFPVKVTVSYLGFKSKIL